MMLMFMMILSLSSVRAAREQKSMSLDVGETVPHPTIYGRTGKIIEKDGALAVHWPPFYDGRKTYEESVGNITEEIVGPHKLGSKPCIMINNIPPKGKTLYLHPDYRKNYTPRQGWVHKAGLQKPTKREYEKHIEYDIVRCIEDIHCDNGKTIQDGTLGRVLDIEEQSGKVWVLVRWDGSGTVWVKRSAVEDYGIIMGECKFNKDDFVRAYDEKQNKWHPCKIVGKSHRGDFIVARTDKRHKCVIEYQQTYYDERLETDANGIQYWRKIPQKVNKRSKIPCKFIQYLDGCPDKCKIRLTDDSPDGMLKKGEVRDVKIDNMRNIFSTSRIKDVIDIDPNEEVTVTWWKQYRNPVYTKGCAKADYPRKVPMGIETMTRKELGQKTRAYFNKGQRVWISKKHKKEYCRGTVKNIWCMCHKGECCYRYDVKFNDTKEIRQIHHNEMLGLNEFNVYHGRCPDTHRPHRGRSLLLPRKEENEMAPPSPRSDSEDGDMSSRSLCDDDMSPRCKFDDGDMSPRQCFSDDGNETSSQSESSLDRTPASKRSHDDEKNRSRSGSLRRRLMQRLDAAEKRMSRRE